MPIKLQKTFEMVDEQSHSLEKILKTSTEVFKETEMKLEQDKWLSMYNKLWIYFLTEPDNLRKAMKLIEAAVKKNWIERLD